MKYVIISGNPKTDGLCHSIMDQIVQGGKDADADVCIIGTDELERCHVCGNGWGTCRENHTCAFGKDGFDDAQDLLKHADCICLITPVYWGEMAEGLKSFLDRVRRCEFGANGALSGKPILLVVSPGGTGNGMLSCLDQMDRFCRHTGAVIFDYIGINRWNNDYKKSAVYAASKAMASGRKAGETI